MRRKASKSSISWSEIAQIRLVDGVGDLGRPAAGIGVASVVEIQHLAQSDQRPIMHIGARRLIDGDVAQGRRAELAILGRALEDGAKTSVDIGCAVRIDLPGLGIERVSRILRRADIVIAEIGEERRLAARTGRGGMAALAAGLALEQLVAMHFLGGQLYRAGQGQVVFRAERIDLGPGFVGGKGLQDPIGARGGAVERLGERGGKRGGIGSGGYLAADAGEVAIVHLDRIGQRPLGLLDQISGAPVAELAARIGLFQLVPMQDRGEGGIGDRGRGAVAETTRHRAFEDGANRAGEAEIRRMAGGAGLAGRLGEAGVKEDRAAQRLDRSHGRLGDRGRCPEEQRA